MKNIIFICPPHDFFTPSQGGSIATCTHECANAAICDGFNVTVLARESDAQPFAGPRVLHYAPLPDPKNKLALLTARFKRKLGGYSQLYRPLYISRIAQLIQAKNLIGIPIVISCDSEVAIRLKILFPRTPVLCWIHSTETCKPRFRPLARTCGVRFAAVSAFEAEKTGRNMGLPPGTIKSAYNGVDHSLFFPAPEPPHGPPLISFHGRTAIEKGPDLLLRAALILAEKGLKFRLQVIGAHAVRKLARPAQERYEDSLKSMAAQLRSKGIEAGLLGRIPNESRPGALRRAHINVVPSRWEESFGLSTAEGMACGLATVASNTGGTPEVLGDAGLLFDSENVGQLAAHLEKLILDEPFRIEMGHRAHQQALKFTWDGSWRSLRAAALG